MHNEYIKILNILKLTQLNPGLSTGTKWVDSQTGLIKSISPVDGQLIAQIKLSSNKEIDMLLSTATVAFRSWRVVPAPKRGDIVRQIGNEFRTYKNSLAELISLEMGKIYSEAQGEVQEMIDVCDFAVGQSRMLYGVTTHSERSDHRMFEQYHPLGIVGVITAFNFPASVWAWNAMIALVCGNVIIWKPSPKTSLCAIAVQKIISKVLIENKISEGVINLICGNAETGNLLVEDKRTSLVSFTGSTAVGKLVNTLVAARLGKVILELGGNNAMIITPDADLKLAVNAAVFSALGTTGQRCTTLRRLIVHKKIYANIKNELLKTYENITHSIGHPLHSDTLVGPLIDKDAVKIYKNVQKQIIKEGGKIIFGGQILNGKEFESGCFVVPAIAEVGQQFKIIKQETFVPLLFLMSYTDFEEALSLQNNVPHGLSSSVFSKNIQETERFISVNGSDCGIANVNIGTSGAEIGLAFGGEKESGGGREAGSDVWKQYMRRQSCTINFGKIMPLAQGVKFNLKKRK